ncbi:MAG: tRNA threonylcarbamoyladenosine dehydratase [Clostridiales bacterium]|nr:tRNA threonylcarbamoyladenosine dehydratase [Clostridiales bacterium]
MNAFDRTKLLLGAKGIDRLKKATVAVFGIGGVGSFTVEALARCGIGGISIFDNDKVCLTNINRQLIATTKTVGEYKVEIMKDRILEINPEAKVQADRVFYSAENADKIDLAEYDYVVDAIDTVSSKIVLIKEAKKSGTPIISCMGAGNKLDPTRFEVTDIYKTSMCPLAKVMRYELRKRGVDSLKVVYSKEPPLKRAPMERDNGVDDGIQVHTPETEVRPNARRQVPGSISFVPSVAGLIIAGEVIRDILGIGRN